jgi:hypothetical protein
MLRSGICPKCQSHDIHSNTFDKSRGVNRIVIGSMSGNAPLDIFVCGSCGYLEDYIANEEDLKTIIKKWPPLA